MNKPISLKHVALIVLSLVIATISLSFYGFIREGALIIICLLLIPMFFYIGYQNSLLIAVSFFVITIGLNIMISATGLIQRIYYRPHEVLQIFDYDMGLARFASNSRAKMRVRHGDLKAVDPNCDCEADPRDVEFKTDSYGFRNDVDYYQQKYLVVGDSFIMGSGTDQKDILSNQLKRKYHIDAYSLAAPANIINYVRYLKYFKKTYGSNFKAFIFVFEGNDFPNRRQGKRERPLLSRIGLYLKDGVKRYRNCITRTGLYRYTFSIYLKLRYSRKAGSQVMVRNIHGHKLGFLKGYVEVTQRTHYGPRKNIEKALSSIKNNIAGIFFIPTKYRVYYDLNGDKNKPLPNSQWDYLQGVCQKLHLKCYNLTADLTKESKRLLAADKFTWWKDDTHWNKYGIAVAAAAVAAAINHQKATAP